MNKPGFWPGESIRSHRPCPLYRRLCSLIPGLGVKLSANILAGPTVLSAVGASPPHDGVRRRWWINVASAVSLFESSQTIGRSHHRHRPGRDVSSRRVAGPEISLCSLSSNLLVRPVELGPVDPHAVKDDCELARDGNLGLPQPVAFGEPRAPSLQRRPFRHAGRSTPAASNRYMRSMASPHLDIRPDQSSSPDA